MRRTILSEEEIQTICSMIGRQLSSRYKFSDEPPVAICVMNGAVPFASDLLKNINIPLIIDYIQLRTYKNVESNGNVVIHKDISIDLQNKDVIIIEDIVDSGISLNFLVDYISKKYRPKSIVTVSLISRVSKRKVSVKLDYCGKEIDEDSFLVGYGLDYHNMFRNIGYVFIPDQQEIDEWNKLSK
ncbi:MAG: hypoxanthine phosphoribosyltransferase [Bacilli bacterium]